jgi:hypothetical protein
MEVWKETFVNKTGKHTGTKKEGSWGTGGGIDSYMDTKAKCRHLKKLSCKETLRQVFIRVYRLEIQSVKSVFSTLLRELLPL